MRNAPGERLLFEAVMARIVQDIRHPRPISPMEKNSGGRTSTLDQLSAIECIIDPHGGVAEWAELMNLDGDWVRQRLLEQSGLSEDPAARRKQSSPRGLG
jgi:hypothetical protein